jgi:signal transduction histidine kinase
MISEGSAFLDRSGRLVASEPAFGRLLGLGSGDPAEALRLRAKAEPALAALLSGEGPASLALAARDDLPACQLSRQACDSGIFLRASPSRAGLAAPPLEHALQALVLTRLASSFAHEIKNPLNAMALQLALLGDKIATASDALAASCAGNVASLKNQISRINEVVRRQLDALDPTPSSGFDLGALLQDAWGLLGHEARRRRMTFTCDAAPGVAHAPGDPVRASRVVVAMLWRAVTDSPEGTAVSARAAASPSDARVVVERPARSEDPALAWVDEVLRSAAAEMGGQIEEEREAEVVRVVLSLPKERTP